MSKKTLLVMLLLLIYSMSFAETNDDSPYKKPAWILDGGLFLGSVGLKGIEKATEENVKTLSLEQVNNLNSDDINWFDKSATKQNSKFARETTGLVTMASFAVPALLFSTSNVRSDWATYSVMYAETFLLTGALTDVVKNLAQRTRPYVYNLDVPIEGYDDKDFDDKVNNKDANKSYFSSDVSLAFSLATFTSITFSDYYPDSKLKPYVLGSTMGYACFTAYLRYASGWHFPTDIISAAIVGSSIGWLVPQLHKNVNVSIGSFNQQNFDSQAISFTFRF